MHICCKKCKKHTRNMFPKKSVLISKNKTKGKSKCAVCLTERTFFHKTEGKYGPESQLEIYLQFFTGWCYKFMLQVTRILFTETNLIRPVFNMI